MKPKGYWTYEKCVNEVKKYKTCGELKKNSPSTYVISCNKNWINEICNHMIKKSGSGFKSKKVSQYSLSGELIKVWDSIKDVKNELKINHISDVCNNKIKSSGNYYWRYFENN
jgi:predicted oxidoreductase (fatty acid repression mutant protein)